MKTSIKYLLIVFFVPAIIFSCSDDDYDDDNVEPTDFTGTFVQEDQMGRPGINTVFTATEDLENAFNTTTPANMVAEFQPDFQARVEAYYEAYSSTAGTTLTYENNILGLDLPTLTTALALDVLQVSPDAPNTTYFESTSNFLTGRTLEDDVIDVSLILLFGGNSGDRFSDMPNLVSDNVAIESGVTSGSFPYLTPAQF